MQAGWSLAASIPKADVRTAPDGQKTPESNLCHKGSRSRWNALKRGVCVRACRKPMHVTGTRNWRTWLPAKMTRYSGTPQRKVASFWPTLKRFKNPGLVFSARHSGRASGRLGGRHVYASILSTNRAQNNNQQTVQTDTWCLCVDWRKKKTNKHKEFWRDTPWFVSPSVPWTCPICPAIWPSLSRGQSASWMRIST